MHLVGAHPLEIKDREHLVQLLSEGSAMLPPTASPASRTMEDSDEEAAMASAITPRVKVGAMAAAKGKAAAALQPGFALARAGDMEGVRRLVEGDDSWDPQGATDKNGSSVLDWAAGEGRLEVCR